MPPKKRRIFRALSKLPPRTEQTEETESETTDTHESYETVSELSQPTERLSQALLKEEPEPEIEIRTTRMTSSSV
jgi:hypothetical protein